MSFGIAIACTVIVELAVLRRLRFDGWVVAIVLAAMLVDASYLSYTQVVVGTGSLTPQGHAVGLLLRRSAGRAPAPGDSGSGLRRATPPGDIAERSTAARSRRRDGT